jgi:hypothetical protein
MRLGSHHDLHEDVNSDVIPFNVHMFRCCAILAPEGSERRSM